MLVVTSLMTWLRGLPPGFTGALQPIPRAEMSSFSLGGLGTATVGAILPWALSGRG